MSESAGRTSSSLAIIERKANTHKPGGCVGIFFQLFDWNRRLSKKKFFPKKLLPPARAKVSKKFNADERLPAPKHLLIADENSGGFPSNKNKNGDKIGLEPKKNEMKAPGLVARLMGLEVMPAAPVMQQDKSNKSSPKVDCKGKGGGGFDGLLHKEESSPEKANVRPQKIQKTGVSERRPVNKFGAEALQIKNVLSRSRKHHQHPPKLASPVKSPKMGRNTSRLIDAAARILEPGIQATNRARCSLTYSNSMGQPCKEDVNNVMREKNVDMDRQTQSNFLERMEVRFVGEEQKTGFDVPASNFREALFHGLREGRSRPEIYLENETEVVLLKTRYHPECATTHAENEANISNDINQCQHFDKIPVSRMFTSQKGASPSVAVKPRTQRHGQMLVGERVPPRSRLANGNCRRAPSTFNGGTETKDFIALNRNISRTRMTVPHHSKSDNNVESDSRFCTGRNDSLAMQRSPVRKRRTLNGGSASSIPERPRGNKGNVMTGNGPRVRDNSVNHTYPKSKSGSQRASKVTDVVSFTFNSPVKSSVGTFSHNEMGGGKRRDQSGCVKDQNSQRKLMIGENGVNKPSQNSLQKNGDALGALLEQKLKELTHQVENEAATGFVPSARTTASILQELISALTAERPTSYEDGFHGVHAPDSQSGCDSVDGVSQAKSRIKRSSDGFSREIDHFSPGCVLDASFSTESCISNSVDDNSGHILQSDCRDLSCDEAQITCTDADLLDSASSANKPRSCEILVIDLLNHTSSVLQNVNLVHARLTGAKLDHVQEILLNAELLLGCSGLNNSSRFVDFLLGPFLDELETLVIAAWKTTVILGVEVRKEENPLRRFLFDCLIECLDVKYIRYINSGQRAWSRLPKCMNADVLIKVFDEEVRKWSSVAGKAPDEIIEREMSTSLGKWTDFEIEAFETGAQIDQDILHTLVDELVIDLVGYLN